MTLLMAAAHCGFNEVSLAMPETASPTRHATTTKPLSILRIVVALLCLSSASAAEEAPLDRVLTALAAEEAAPVERIRMFIEKDGNADVYYIDRIRPGRTRVLKNPRQGGPEVIVIDSTQWLRTKAGWQKTPAPAVAGVVPSMAKMFRQGLTDAIEQVGPDGSRTIEGAMSWTNAATCNGRLKIRIENTGLPSLMRFEGTCGGKPARFRQAFSYTGPVTIAPPE